ncbi:hypothetical protein GOBAR_AA12996 [Gossypium barbadense]|uniref:Elongation factor P C-terminal domain-containing protein n=1 Tax=Gossypium barbadense TaxID=3634 RepID=A0A2P5XWC4_GOSBA|nr:hypothetical protein GOBAR_AA12996 [Gossypium barbadense]
MVVDFRIELVFASLNVVSFMTEEMKVTLELYDGRPLTASVPKRVTCTIKETQTPMKGVSATPRYKKALLDNGVTVQCCQGHRATLGTEPEEGRKIGEFAPWLSPL